MNLDLREMLVCLLTIVVIAAAAVVAVGAAATTSYMMHASPPQQAAYGTSTVASAVDPCVNAFAMPPLTTRPESGLQCPIDSETAG